MAHLYYSESLNPENAAPGSVVTVTGDEARHAVRVSRLRIGETIHVGSGNGLVVTGTVTAAAKDSFSVEVATARVEPGAAPQLVLVQALAKGDRDERAVEQATEFGVDRIIPWEADRSVSRWGAEKAERGREKWQRIAREAAKQSVRAWVPEVSAPLRSGEVADLASDPQHIVVILHPRGQLKLSELASGGHLASAHTIFLVVGPEGGVSEAELEQFESSGAHTVQLGSTVLRTSSAGPAALAVLNVALSRW